MGIVTQQHILGFVIGLKNDYCIFWQCLQLLDHNILCSCKRHQDATWHHNFTTIVNMTICSIFGSIYIYEFILIYFNDLKLRFKNTHLFLWLKVINMIQFV